MCQHNMLVSEGTYSLTCTEPFAKPPATHLPSRPHAQAVTDTRPGLANFGFITYRQVQIISIFLLVSDHQHHPVHPSIFSQTPNNNSMHQTLKSPKPKHQFLDTRTHDANKQYSSDKFHLQN
jgi:hypothetical protein